MSDGPVWESKEGVLVRVVVKPRSSERELIAEITENFIVINLNSPARAGKANIELVKRLSKLLKVSSADTIVVAGHKSREKTILIRGIEKEQVSRAFQCVTNDK
jgi:uncharacterized protein (TIGR00251 family)